MLVLDITDCSDTSVTVDFQRRENVSGTNGIKPRVRVTVERA
jgi:hypothetical protein